MPSSDSQRPSPLYRWLLGSLLTLLFFALTEMVLVLVGIVPLFVDSDPYVGFSGKAPMFVTEEEADSNETWMALAPQKRRLFNYQRFPLSKAQGSYRIFCLGGSTTYGRPYDHTTSFCGWLEAFLGKADPSRRWEVINLGGISYASYRVAAMMPELGRYQPDLYIVYSGHNEFLEERTYRGIVDMPEWLRDLNIQLSRLRTYSLLKRSLQPSNTSTAGQADERTALAAEVDDILKHTVGPDSYERDDRLREQIAEHYRFNLERMIRLARSRGSDIQFIMPAAKLRNETPFKSTHREGLRGQDREDWKGFFRAGKQRFNQHRYEAALDHFDKALKLDDRYAGLHYWRGQALFELERYDDARSAFQRSVDEDVAPLRMPGKLQNTLQKVAAENQVTLIDFPSLIGNVSRQRWGHELPGERLFLDHVHPTIEMHKLLALELLDELSSRQIVRRTPTWNEQTIAQVTAERMASLNDEKQRRALINLSAVVGWGGKLEEAHALLRRSQREFGNSPLILSLLALSSERRGKMDEAMEFASQAVELYPTRYDAWLDLAHIFKKTNNTQKAISAYQRALTLKPDSVTIRKNLAVLLVQEGQNSQAIKQYSKIIELDPTIGEAFLNLGVLQAEMGQIKQAEKHFRQALARDPEQAYAYFALAVIAQQRNQPEKALEHYRKAQELDPTNAEVANNMGILLARLGQLESAIRQLEKAVELQPDYLDARHNLDAARTEMRSKGL